MAASDKPKLFYFDVPGLAEVTRLIFVYTGNEFEDVRFMKEEWGSKYKAEAPLGMAPFYEEGGVKLGGSLAIARYVAEKYGLGGKTPLENAQLDSYADAIKEILTKSFTVMFASEDKKEGCKAEFMKDIPAKFGFIEKQVRKDSFFDDITWPDLMIYNVCTVLTSLKLEDTFKDCPKIKAIHAKFAENEKIKAHNAKHAPKP